jgi:F0F1-type ATP synthase membrane subunit b/b'
MFSNNFNNIFWIFINIIISIMFIYGSHICWNNIKDTYSTRKTKDLVNTQIQKYKKIMKELEESHNEKTKNYLNESEKLSMDQLLTDFMQKI